MTKTLQRTLTTLTLAAMTALPAIPTTARAQATPSNPQLASRDINDRVDALMKKMSLEQKIGQLVQYSYGSATGPNASHLSYEDLIARGEIGSLLNIHGSAEGNRLQHIAVEKSPLHIPLLYGLDVIHGMHTTFPVPIALACSWDPALIRSVAHTAAAESRAEGVPWVFSPMVDIARDARWGRIVESAGEDPYLGSALARAYVEGYQQGDLSKPDSVAVSVKHFAAYGAAIAGRDYNATDMSDVMLRQVYLPPYHAAVAAGAATVMSSFNSINGVPASANPYTLTQILRREWGFDGFVVSDWGAVSELLNHSIGANGSTVARKAITAGVDMDMEGGLYATTLAAQVRSGVIPESVIDEATRRILRVKFALGLFDHPYTATTPAYVATPEKRAEARRAADETIVLLKNEPVEGLGNILPLGKHFRTVALIGPLADSKQDMLGSWAALGNPNDAVTLRQALSEKLGNQLLYAKGVSILKGENEADLRKFLGKPATPVWDNENGIAAAVAIAKKADVAVLALGESANGMTGEASSRAHLSLPGDQEKLLEAVAATGKPVVLVLFTGRPSEIPWAAGHLPAIVQAWFPGIEAGHAVADVLFGTVNPSAKLTSSFPRAVGQEPLYYAQLPTGRPAHGDLNHFPTDSAQKYLSRYLDVNNSAQFPFGWGLSYTSFRFSQPTLSQAEIAASSLKPGDAAKVQVSFTVTNTGSRAGTEVAQLYIRNTAASVEQPVRQLEGFARVTLQPGESKTVTLPLGFDELNFWNAQSHQVVEPTTYQVFVGDSSLADLSTSLTVR